jgi:hypothetical protein
MAETNQDMRKRPNGLLDEVADFLHVSERSVLNYQRQGLLTPVYFGKKRMFRWSEVEKLARTGVPRRNRKEQPEEVTA